MLKLRLNFKASPNRLRLYLPYNVNPSLPTICRLLSILIDDIYFQEVTLSGRVNHQYETGSV